MQTITIEVTPAGTVSIETNGFKGASCAKATEQIEIVLGGAGAASKKKKKPEFFQSAGTAQQIKRTF